MEARGKKTAWVILNPGFEEVEAITPVDFLRRAGLRVTTLGVGGLCVRGSHDIEVMADRLLEEAEGLPDALVLPGGPGAKTMVEHPALVDLIHRQFAAGGLVGAICAAPVVVLGPLGYLKGREYTCFLGMESLGPEGVFRARAVVEDGNLVTSRSAGTAAEFSEALVNRLAGSFAARELAEKTWQHWVRES